MSEYSNRSGRAAVVIVILVFVLAGSAGAWYLFIYKPAQEAKEKARLEQLAKEEAERKRLELEAQQKARYEKLIEDADVEFEQGNWETAQALYTEASSLFPDQQYPRDQLTVINAKLEEIAAQEALEAKREAGTVEKVSSRTGRFYVIVSSSIDDDLAMDYAKKLVKEGNTVKIIEHNTGKLIFYRVSPGDYDTLGQAEAALASFSSYGEGVWVLKY